MIVTTTDLQNSFGKYLQLCRGEEIIITKNGKSVAKLVPYYEEDAGFRPVRESSPADRSGGVRVSYEEYLQMTETSEHRYEYIDGEIILLASTLYPHQRAVKEIFGEFINWFRDKQCEPLGSPFDVTLYRLGNEKKINVIYIYLFRNHDIESVLTFKDADRACSAVFPGLAVNLEEIFG